ncbi:hypothetical protein [Micromonospora auratinigra]|uniref:Uncharacterized protein n=1 Tax=Micromonospora auratinigra TaxID=261654 RepID=A0A1A8Z8U5_9ACTN|nr:hypothetical protein [Micromonospora auratinigra]SBT40277.1 hypothetical protein GA0070611_1197 [Micromonospora auratinigra]
MKSLTWAATAITAALATVLSGGPAAAVDAPQPATTTSSAAATDVTITWHWRPTSCGTSWTYRDRWGHTGTFKCSSDVMEVNWYNSGRIEYFGVAPNRTIWHSWATSGWTLMPHNGLADGPDGAWVRYGNVRTVRVYVSGSGYWCSDDAGSGWGAWWKC